MDVTEIWRRSRSPSLITTERTQRSNRQICWGWFPWLVGLQFGTSQNVSRDSWFGSRTIVVGPRTSGANRVSITWAYFARNGFSFCRISWSARPVPHLSSGPCSRSCSDLVQPSMRQFLSRDFSVIRHRFL